MLLTLKKEDTLKRKFVVFGIWFYSILFFSITVYQCKLYYIDKVEISLLSLGIISILAFISIMLIFKSKMARLIILLNLYIGLWASIILWLMSLYLYFLHTSTYGLFNIIIQILGIFFISLIIYLFSNKEASQLFKIKDLKKDFYWLFGISLGIVFVGGLIYALNNDISQLVRE